MTCLLNAGILSATPFADTAGTLVEIVGSNEGDGRLCKWSGARRGSILEETKMLREILFGAIAVAWGANSEAQLIPNPAHSCLESICGPVDVVQPYSYQLRKEMKTL